MSSAQKKWTALLVILLALFAFFTPLWMYHAHPVIVASLEAVLCGGVLFLALSNFGSVAEAYWDEGLDEEGKPDPGKAMPVLAAFGATLFFIFLFTVIPSSKIKQLLKKDGVQTSARVINGSSFTMQSLRRRSSTYTLKLAFDTPQGQTLSADIQVDAALFHRAYKGQQAEIVYLPQMPSIVRLLETDEDVKEFTGISNRPLTFQDLKTLLTLADDTLKSHLDKISFKWQFQRVPEVSGAVLLTNGMSGEEIMKAGPKLLYRTMRDVLVSENDEFLGGEKVLLFQKDGRDNEYLTQDYLIASKLDIEESGAARRVVIIQKR